MAHLRTTAATLIAALRQAYARRRAVALRAAAAVAAPLVIGLIAGYPAAGAQASFGGLAALYVPDAPFRYRARVVGAVGAGLVAAVFLGSLAGSLGWVAAAVTAAVVTGIASFVCQATELPPPRELMLVMAVLAATEMPGDLAQAATHAALTAAGAALAWIISMSAAIGHHNPERRSLAAALEAVATYLDAIAGAGEATARHQAVAAVRRAVQAVEQGGHRSADAPAAAAMATERLLEAALHQGVLGHRPDPRCVLAVRSLIPAILGAADPIQHELHVEGFEGADSPSLRAAVDGLIGAIGGAAPDPWPAAAPRLWSRLRAAGRRDSVILPAAARIGVAVGAGVAIGGALGVSHAYWVGLTVCAVLQGSNITVTWSRFLLRLLGTLAGVGIVFVVLAFDPPLLIVIAVVAAAQIAVELVITVNYGLAVTAITVLALLLFHVGAPAEEVGGIVGARVLDTILGAVVALALRLILWPKATRARLPQVQARTLRSVHTILDQHWSPAPDVTRERSLRHRLLTDLLDLRAAQADALADTLRAPAADELRWSVTAIVDHLAVLTLAMPADRSPPPPVQATSALAALHELADAIAAGRTARLPHLPALDDYPRLTAELTTLAAAASDAGSDDARVEPDIP